VAGVNFSDSAPVRKCLSPGPDPVRVFFKFENPTPVQTSATIVDPTLIYPCFYLRNDRTDSGYCRNGKVTPNPGPVFHKFLTPGLGAKKTPNSAEVDFGKSDSVPTLFYSPDPIKIQQNSA